MPILRHASHAGSATRSSSFFFYYSSATVIDHSTTVQQGQTLSEVAAQQLPQLPIADAVARIQVANDLPTNQVHAGQALLIPAVG